MRHADAMVGWALLLFLLAAVFAVKAIWPRAAWWTLAAWQFRNPEAAEPSDGGYALHRVSAGVATVILAGTAIWVLTADDDRRCERIMAQLDEAVDDAGFGGSDVDVSDIDDDGGQLVDFDELEEDLGEIDTRLDLDLAANGLGVELVGQGRSLDVVDEDGDVLGTLDEHGAHPRC
jgi:hypothetical protein